MEELPKLKKIIPGPGVYEAPSIALRKTASKFGKAKRNLGASIVHTPGPGEYSLPVKFNDLPDYLIPKSKRITRI